MEGQMTIFDFLETPKYQIRKPIRLIELFGGIGSQAMALKRLGAEFEHYRLVEFDKYCIDSYNAIHGTHFVPMDITQTTGADLGIEDTNLYEYILTYSFPCTDLSVAGKMMGMSKGSGTRSGLLWEVERILNELEHLPQVLLMENVPQVNSAKNKADFQSWKDFLESKGYSNFHQVINAADMGVAQSRKRMFMVSILGTYTYTFPTSIKLETCMKDYLEDEVDEKYYIKSEKAKILIDKLIEGGKILTDRQTDRPAICHLLTQEHQTSQTASVQGMTKALRTEAEKEAVLLKHQGSELSRYTDVANTLMARDYKGFGNQDMNGVIECKQIECKQNV